MSFCKDIYPELYSYLENKKGTEKETDDTTGTVRFTLRGKAFVTVIANGTDDAALITYSGSGLDDAAILMHPDISVKNSGSGSRRTEVTVKLTGSVPYEVVRDMCDRGYNVVLRHFSKKVQHEILEDIWQ